MNDHLTLVPAGAGAGKTWRIEKTLAQWIEDGLVAPGRVLAVTFTEAAASELRERIRAELMKRGRVEDALEIDRAYVGTIHALGQRLLTEHTFAAGRSPNDRLLSEPERDLLIRGELAKCEALQPLMRDLARFGYSWNPLSGASAEDTFRTNLLRTVDLLRGLGERGQSPDILTPALQSLEERYGDRAPDGEPLNDALRRAAQKLLASFPQSLAADAPNASARKDFADNHTVLRRASEEGALDRDWKFWQSLRNLRQTKRGAPTPEGYDTAAQLVMDAAEELLRHPGPLEDAKAHLSALVIGAQEILSAYQQAKKQSGLIDYSDMIVETETLLRTRPEILQAVLAEIDCVVIDEFQDTNPVQFALLWRLARSAKRALIVGDTKQSIMGFQGADARLSDALLAAHPDSANPLDKNWRSDPRIMDFVNAIGPALFPGAYNPLSATRPETGVTALEAIVLPRSWVGGKKRAPDCIADRITSLLSDEELVWDKREKRMRSAEPADIAVLCYTSTNAQAVANALRARGLPVRTQADGWLSSPVMRAARAGLAYAADPNDLFAAITWLTLGPPEMSLQDALRDASAGTLQTQSALKPLRALNLKTDEYLVGDIVADLLRATNLRDWACGLETPPQALADLARFEAEALEFDRLALDLRAAAGFHGSGPQVFLGWISVQTEKEWNRHPDADGWSGTGIEISTWHAAKGREWPIVVVAGLDFAFPARPGTLRAEFDGFDDLENVLAHAGLSWLPDLAAPEKQQAYADALIEADERDAARALYVALTRARDRLILTLPAGPSSEQERPKRMIDLLRDRTGLQIEAGHLTVLGKMLPARITVEARDREFPDPSPVEEPLQPRFGKPAPELESFRTPWRRSPSSLEGNGTPTIPELEHVALGTPVTSKVGDFDTATDRGTAWHLAFRTLCERPDLRDRLTEATGLDKTTLDAIAAQASAVKNWLASQGYHRLHFELPVQAVAKDGSETNAIIDCLAEADNGILILDHKSGPCPEPDARFTNYLPQLEAYAELVAAMHEKPVKELAINWMNEGMISATTFQTQEET